MCDVPDIAFISKTWPARILFPIFRSSFIGQMAGKYSIHLSNHPCKIHSRIRLER